MTYEVTVETLGTRTLAAVRRRVPMNNIAKEFRPALDRVWAFLKKNPGLRTDGHNVFLYHHENPEIMPVDFGVEVVGAFTGEGEVQCVTTPAGEAAVVVHRGALREHGRRSPGPAPVVRRQSPDDRRIQPRDLWGLVG